jgi:hypothetical protein
MVGIIVWVMCWGHIRFYWPMVDWIFVRHSFTGALAFGCLCWDGTHLFPFL